MVHVFRRILTNTNFPIPIGGFAAGLTFASLSDSTGSSPITRRVLPQRREGRRGSLRPRQIDRASCEADAMPEGVYRELREAHDRTTARWPTAPWMLARACTAKNVGCVSPERASRTQSGVSVALPPVIKARVSVYRASAARPAMLCGNARTQPNSLLANAHPLAPSHGRGIFYYSLLPGVPRCFTPGCVLVALTGLAR